MNNPEFIPEQLEAARDEVAALYMGDQMEKVLGGFQGEDTRDQLWAETANTHTPFTEKITGLRQAFKGVAETEKAYGPQLAQVGRLPFRQVEDILAQDFLRDVLFSRITLRPGYIDYGIEMPTEVQSMAQELGFKEGFRAEPGVKVTLDQTVEAVLVGRLRFQYQPTPPRGK